MEKGELLANTCHLHTSNSNLRFRSLKVTSVAEHCDLDSNR